MQVSEFVVPPLTPRGVQLREAIVNYANGVLRSSLTTGKVNHKLEVLDKVIDNVRVLLLSTENKPVYHVFQDLLESEEAQAAVIAPTSLATGFKSATLGIGSTKAIKLIVEPSEATTDDSVFKSSDESVVIVENGVLVGVGAGKATVSVSLGGLQASVAVTVK